MRVGVRRIATDRPSAVTPPPAFGPVNGTTVSLPACPALAGDMFVLVLPSDRPSLTPLLAEARALNQRREPEDGDGPPDPSSGGSPRQPRSPKRVARKGQLPE